jgi:hypothetical protein
MLADFTIIELSGRNVSVDYLFCKGVKILVCNVEGRNIGPQPTTFGIETQIEKYKKA